MKNEVLTVLEGDALTKLKELADESVHCIVTSPPYFGLRDYGHPGQIGQELTPADYVAAMVAVFREARRVLRKDGTLWLNIGDSYMPENRGENAQPRAAWEASGPQRGRLHADLPTKKARIVAMKKAGFKRKDLLGIPWRVALALHADGWFLRSDIIWNKPNPMTESVRDRPTKAHEYIFLFTKSDRYHCDMKAIEEPQSEHERTRRLREQAEGLDTKFTLRRDQAHGQVKPGANGVARSAKARQALAVKGTRNKRTVWTVACKGYDDAHFATFPPELIEPCIVAGCPAGGVVLDMFGGSGTTGKVALERGRKAILIELNPDYDRLMQKRTSVNLGLGL